MLCLLGLPAGAAAAYPGHDAVKAKVPAPAVPRSIGKRAVSIAKSYLGVRYVWGGDSPKKGFDCSGLTMFVYAKLGIGLTHYTGAQWRQGYRLTIGELKRGDLVFFHPSKDGPQHNGIYIGEGKFIHAPHTGDVVKISSLADGNYKKSYVGAVRPYGFGPPIIFPVLGPVRYTNDFGTTSAQGTHQGINVMAPRKAVVVAAEPGTVQLSHSRAGGCILTLYGYSLTTYVYSHLNNDLTSSNDNTGHCVAGTAYPPGLVAGAKVVAGQIIGFVGDSGNADGVQPHLDFEVHPRRGTAVNSYPFLNRGKRLLFATLPGRFQLRLTGRLVSAVAVDSEDSQIASVKMRVDRLRAWPGGFIVSRVSRTMTVEVLDTTIVKQQVDDTASGWITVDLETLLAAKNKPVVVNTVPERPTLDAQLGRTPLSAADVVLKLPSS